MRVIARLHELGLLPEAKRLSVVESIRELAVETPDSGFLRDEFRGLFSEQEFYHLLSDIASEFVPNLEKQIDDWRFNWDGDDDPEDHFSGLIEALNDYRDVFQENDDIICAIDRALGQIGEVIDDLCAEMSKEPEYDDVFEGGGWEGARDDSRSIFDDVDQ